MPKLPGKQFSNAEPRDVDLVDVVVDDENDCLKFEQRLNELLDLRCRVGEVSQDAHVLACDRCQEMLEDYQGMLEATELLSAMHDDNSDVDEDVLIAVGRASSLGRAPVDLARNQFFGWSTLLAVLFVFWGTSAGVPTDKSLTERVSPASLARVQSERTELVSGLNLAGLLGDPVEFANHLVAANPLAQSTPSNCQSFSEMPTGRMWAAGFPVVDLASFEIEQFSHIGRYWQHASRLPGFEPWQHSVNFAIGWFNQLSPPSGNPQCS